MQVEIEKIITEIEVIDVELPYYYKQDCGSEFGDVVFYGKIEENSVTIIDETSYDEVIKYEISKTEHHSIKNSGYSCYFGEKYKSTKEEFESVKQRCTSFLLDF